MHDDPGTSPDTAALRRAVLAVAVLDDVDVEPRPDGVLVPSPAGPPTFVAWPAVAAALGRRTPESPVVRARLTALLRGAALLTAPPDQAWVTAHVRAVALPVDHAVHPGAGWALGRVLGGVLEVGLGLVDAWAGAPDLPVPLPPQAWSAAGMPAGPTRARWWEHARDHARRMGVLAAARVAAAPGGLRPVGGCDVLTLLAARPLRAALATGDGSGLRAVAVPARSRGWYDLRRVDPAFVGAVWSATDEADRGLSRPVLVTRDEVGLPRGGGAVVSESLDRR